MAQIKVEALDKSFGTFHAVRAASFTVEDGQFLCLLGPSGCGKTTFLRVFNRMYDLVPGTRAIGEVLIDGHNVLSPDTDVINLRRQVGMLFQRANPFPKSIFDNVAYGPHMLGWSKQRISEVVEESLKDTGLWDEVKDRLRRSALNLSGGQQQRLCLARALAVKPEVVLMDEPASALDPVATHKIEELIVELKKQYTIVIVTHNMQQAARVSDTTAFFLLGNAASMAVAALAWIMIAGYRLKQFPDDFKALNSELYLLFLVSIGTIAFPIITAVMLGTYLPAIWATQGLFLFGVLIVCSSSYPIERFYAVNLAVLVIGIALVAVVVAAPIHAIYRNSRSYEEARNFYLPAALELTRQWHEQSNKPMPAVSGDDALAFATAFYSPDHPVYARPFVYQYTWGLPRKTTLDRGWAALCFDGQEACIEWMAKTAARASQFIRSEIVIQSTLLGWPGTTKRLTTLIVPPRNNDEIITPSLAPIGAEDISSNRRSHSNTD